MKRLGDTPRSNEEPCTSLGVAVARQRVVYFEHSRPVRWRETLVLVPSRPQLRTMQSSTSGRTERLHHAVV